MEAKTDRESGTEKQRGRKGGCREMQREGREAETETERESREREAERGRAAGREVERGRIPLSSRPA